MDKSIFCHKPQLNGVCIKYGEEKNNNKKGRDGICIHLASNFLSLHDNVIAYQFGFFFSLFKLQDNL